MTLHPQIRPGFRLQDHADSSRPSVSQAIHDGWVSAEAVPVRLGRSNFLRPVSMAQNGVALAKRHDRSGGKLSRILSAMPALEAFFRIRQTITDSWCQFSPTSIHSRSPYK
jgi:hypothetical protein